MRESERERRDLCRGNLLMEEVGGEEGKAEGRERSLWKKLEDGSVRVYPHPGQQRALDSPARFIFIIAGTQSGKTSFGPIWLWQEIRRNHSPSGGNDYLAVTSSYDLFKLKMLPSLREWFEYTLHIGRWWPGAGVIELANPYTGQFIAKRADDPMWGRIILRSASSTSGLESSTARAAWLDECGQDEFTIDSLDAIVRRLALHQGRILGTTTPYNMGFLKTEIYDRWKGGDPSYDVIQFPSTLNPSFPREEFEHRQASMPSWKFRMFYCGEFAKPEGMVYDCFDESIHVVDPYPLPSSMSVCVGIDFGSSNAAAVWVAYDPLEDIYVCYRDHMCGKMATLQMVEEIKALSAGEPVTSFTGGARSEEGHRMDWASLGLTVTKPSISDVAVGIARVYSLLALRKLCFFRSCKGLLDEIGMYRYRATSSSSSSRGETIDNRRRFHRLDALRYAVTAVTSNFVEYAPTIWR